MRRFVYADNAATTAMDVSAYEAMKPFLTQSYGNPSQLYSFSRAPKKALSEARRIIADCIGAAPEEIYFTSGGTESDNWAIKCIGRSQSGRIITSAFEHHAILHSCAALEREGKDVQYLIPTKEGRILVDQLLTAITDNTSLVSIMYANNELGTIQPIKELCAVAHEFGAVFHTDAVQAIGHVEIDVKEIGVDFLSASAHKFNGPKGVGFLYVRGNVPIPAYMSGGAQEKGLRAGTENVAAIVGMAEALKNNVSYLRENRKHVKELEHDLLTGLNYSQIEYVRNGTEPFLPGVISLSFRGLNGEALLHRLDLLGICVSTGSACDSKNTNVSHVLKAIQLDEEVARGTLRISLGKNNTQDDVHEIVQSLKRVTDYKG